MSKISTPSKTLAVRNPLHTKGIHTTYAGNPEHGKDDSGSARRMAVVPALYGKTIPVDPATEKLLRDQGAVKK